MLVHKCNVLLQFWLNINANFSRFYCNKNFPNYQRSKLGDRSKTPHSAPKQIGRDVNRAASRAVRFWKILPCTGSAAWF